MLDEKGENLKALAEILAEGRTAEESPVSRSLRKALERAADSSSRAAVVLAQDALFRDADDEVIALAARLPGDAADPASQHTRHLAAVALLRSGDARGALDLLEAGNAIPEKTCSLEPDLRSARTLLDGPAAGSAAGRFLRALEEADQAFSAGEAARAIQILDVGVVWASEVREALARLARAWLEVPATTPRDRFRKRRALASLVHRANAHELLRRTLFGCSGSLAQSEVDAIVGRAEAWLEGGSAP